VKKVVGEVLPEPQVRIGGRLFGVVVLVKEMFIRSSVLRTDPLQMQRRQTSATDTSTAALAFVFLCSALDDVDREATSGRLLVLGRHVGAGLPHRGDDAIERHLVLPSPSMARRAALSAFTAPMALRSMHGTCTGLRWGHR